MRLSLILLPFAIVACSGSPDTDGLFGSGGSPPQVTSTSSGTDAGPPDPFKGYPAPVAAGHYGPIPDWNGTGIATITRSDTGVYDVYLTTGYPEPQIVVTVSPEITPAMTSVKPDAAWSPQGVGVFKVFTWDQNGPQDYPFTFQAVRVNGP